MMDSLLTLPSHLRERLASALETGSMEMDPSESAIRATLGIRESGNGLAGALRDLQKLGITGPAAAAWLRTLDKAANRNRKPDLVWSGPSIPGLHARNSRQVYEELLGSARHSLWASTYAFFDGPKAFEVLARSMEIQPGLRVTLLLNIQRRRGDNTASEYLVRQFADRFWKSDWPGAVRPQVWYDPRSIELEGPSGVLHAKAVVADEETVFVTSANLTEAAFDRNIELGLLVLDSALAASVVVHFQGLIDREILKPLPGN